jgi:hypothetical protein
MANYSRVFISGRSRINFREVPILHTSCGITNAMKYGSPAFAVKEAGIGGVSVHTHAHTPNSGYLPRKFLKSLKY